MSLEVLCEEKKPKAQKTDRREAKRRKACFSDQNNSSSFWNWDNRVEEAMGKLS